MKRHHITRLIFALLGLGLLAWPFVRVHRIERRFALVDSLDNADNVRQKMGKPWKDGQCGAYSTGSAPGCAREFVYAHPLAPYVPRYWVIDFDAGGRILSREAVSRP